MWLILAGELILLPGPPRAAKKWNDARAKVLELIYDLGSQGTYRNGELWRGFTNKYWWISPGYISVINRKLVRYGLVERVNPEAYKSMARYRVRTEVYHA